MIRILARLLGGLVLLACTACTTKEAPETEIHCFNERLTLPGFVDTKCPTINPAP